MKILGLQKISDPHMQAAIRSLCETASVTKLYNTDEFGIVPNPNGIHPYFDLYPLAKTPGDKLNKVSAILTDMDGTTTTTEVLCLHSLEYMVQKITSRQGSPAVAHLDEEADYPHIIGNSTTKHVEYLINKYGNAIDTRSLMQNYIFAALWTLLYSPDAGRKNDVTQTLKLLQIYPHVQQATKNYTQAISLSIYAQQLCESLPEFITAEKGIRVRMAIDIYYQRYHDILKQIAEGKAQLLAEELTQGKRLIEPMKGIAIFLSLIKGLLGDELQSVLGVTDDSIAAVGKFFETRPTKIALVTSSIFYEANIVLGEVFKVLQTEVAEWDISDGRKQSIITLFSDYRNVYDAVITASDSNEIRLKPHRDLYSIALYQLGIPVTEFPHALGFEDSESGLLAIRAAGVGRAIGIPFEATKGHSLEAASTILQGGLQELITKHHFFLNLSHTE